MVKLGKDDVEGDGEGELQPRQQERIERHRRSLRAPLATHKWL